MLRFLKGVVGGASGTGLKDLPYNIGDPYPSAWGSWTHHRGTSSKVRVTHPLLFSFSLYLSVTYDA
jgi:SCY1-like protein 1